MLQTHSKQAQGLRNYYQGHQAETCVATHYETQGYHILERRWRGAVGEIDLIAQRDETTVFIEVKKAKTHEDALFRLRPNQLHRIYESASEYISLHKNLTAQIRLDLAAVDAFFQIQILENISLPDS